jgi:hypothetical protein
VGIVQRFENRLEQMVSGAFARAFRSAVQPVELAAALQREVDNSAQILSRDRRLVPNRFQVELSSTDHERLAPYSATLTRELTTILREHADEQHYVFTGPVSIDLAQADDLGTGRFRVRSRAQALVESHQPPGVRAGAGTGVYVEVNGTRHPLVPPGLVVGRGSDADLRINDPGVSRRHAEIRVVESGPQGPEVSVLDLGSTNGLQVDGRRSTQARLGDGSRVRIGNTDLVVRFSQSGTGGEAGGGVRG